MSGTDAGGDIDRRNFIGGGIVASGAAFAGLGIVTSSSDPAIVDDRSPISLVVVQAQEGLLAQVEECGWVLRITLPAAPGGFGDYALDPDGAARVMLRSSHPGFGRSAGAVVAGSMVRSTVATVPLRKPVNPALRQNNNPNYAPLKVIDETDLGSGVIQVRLALSETIYATDSDLALTMLDGWRIGAPAATAMPVANDSRIVAPIPIFRWVLAPYDVAHDGFRLSLLVASHHPVGFDPVAGVRFTVTDGITTKVIWATSLATDNTHGDNLRCHSVIVDPVTATALNAGLLRCDAEVYPWLGAMRSTDRAGTRSMIRLSTAAYSTNAESPWVIGYDPQKTRYSNQFAYIDPVNGSDIASASMIAGSRAAAKAISPSFRPRDVMTAIQSARLIGRTLPAANGGMTAVNSVDGLVATLAPGIHGNAFGTTSVSTTISCTEIPIVVEGDPDVADARRACILQTLRTANTRVSRTRFRRLTIEAGSAALASPSTYNFIDDVEIRGRSGSQYATTAPLGSGRAPAGHWNLCATKSRVWRTGWRLKGGATGPGLVRACENSLQAEGFCLVKNRWIPKAEDGHTASNTTEGYGMWYTTTEVAALEDVFCAFNDMRSLVWAGWRPRSAAAALAGTPNGSFRRHVVMSNVFERMTELSTPFFGYGESSWVTMSYLIIEGNTLVGSGFNAFYSDPRPTNVVESNTLYNDAFVIRLANNAMDRNASKQDDFSDPDTIRARGGAPAHGYRPHMTYAWGPHFGVGLEANYDASRAGTIANYRREFPGLRSVQEVTPTNPAWTDDRSLAGANGGGGSYVPSAASQLLGRVVRGNTDQDWAGRPIVMNGAAGALQPA